MMRFYKFFEWAYIVIAAFFLFEAFRIWEVERNRAYLFLLFVAVAVAMFFFKRHFRKKIERNSRNQ